MDTLSQTVKTSKLIGRSDERLRIYGSVFSAGAAALGKCNTDAERKVAFFILDRIESALRDGQNADSNERIEAGLLAS